MGRRLALLIATYDYQDTGLRRLTAPAHDAEAFAAVLRDPAIAGFEVTTLVNEPHHLVGEAIGDFYRDRRRDDLTLLYFTGHGLKDDDGRLYLAMSNTRRDSLLFTALSAEHVDQAMGGSSSRQKVLILDCCYSGAFPAGRIAKADTAIHALERFQGRGRTVLTASDATQYSFEGNQLHGQAPQSVFTRYLVAGLRDGSADLDGDGDITLDELYSYVRDRVVEEMPQQRPKKQDNVEGRTVIAKNINWTLPAYLRNAIGSPIANDRLGALDGLAHLYRIGNDVVRTSVLDEIRRLVDDDSKLVSAAAAAGLRSVLPRPPQTTGPPETSGSPETPSAESAGRTPQPPQQAATTPPGVSPAPDRNSHDRTPATAAGSGPSSAQPTPPTHASESTRPPEGPRSLAATAPVSESRPRPDAPTTARPDAPGPDTGTGRGPRLLPRTRRSKVLTAGATLLVLTATVIAVLLSTRGGSDSTTSGSGEGPSRYAPQVTDPATLPSAGSWAEFSPDGKTLATSSDDTVRLWNLATSKTTATLTGQTAKGNGVAFSPDGKTIATQDADRTDNITVRLRNVATGKTTVIRTGHPAGVSWAFSPDSKTLATASTLAGDPYDNPVRLWEVATGKTTATLTDGNGGTFSPDGKTLATSAGGGPVTLVSLAPGHFTATASGSIGDFESMAFSPDGTLAAAGKGGTVWTWNVAPSPAASASPATTTHSAATN
ncbi:caspase family protein [Streptomyces sp. R41]|uniref:Caspase family protein n=1 Tax=Streptomyces sp. R41 TaxID=3238632 RepID=A0AB39R7L6_9ACTN